MNRSWRRFFLFTGLAGLLLHVQGQSQVTQPLRPADCMEAVAETRLLMDGIAHPNYQGLERILKNKPKNAEAWKYARGQAILIAEAGNLLLLRPPKNQGAKLWSQRSVELREASTQLARSLAKQNFATSQLDFKLVANVCNRCHHNFRVARRFEPFAAPKARLDSSD